MAEIDEEGLAVLQGIVSHSSVPWLDRRVLQRVIDQKAFRSDISPGDVDAFRISAGAIKGDAPSAVFQRFVHLSRLVDDTELLAKELLNEVSASVAEITAKLGQSADALETNLERFKNLKHLEALNEERKRRSRSTVFWGLLTGLLALLAVLGSIALAGTFEVHVLGIDYVYARPDVGSSGVIRGEGARLGAVLALGALSAWTGRQHSEARRARDGLAEFSARAAVRRFISPSDDDFNNWIAGQIAEPLWPIRDTAGPGLFARGSKS